MRRRLSWIGWWCAFVLAATGCPDDATTADTAPDAALDTTRDEIFETRDASPDTARDATPETTRDAADSDTPPSTAVMRLHMLDVGQGDAILIELPCGAMLIDTGGEDTVGETPDQDFDGVAALEDQLRAFFISRPDLHNTLDLLVLSHPHIDHTRGVDRLVEMVQAGELTIANVVTNGAEDAGSGIWQQRNLHDFADSAGIPRDAIRQAALGPSGLSDAIIDPFPTCDGVDPKITALWGAIDDASPYAATWDSAELANKNNHSVVLRVDFGAASALLTGDLEAVGIGALIAIYGASGLLDVDVYKAGHHGSYNGTTAALINAMTPAAALISAGPFDRVGPFTAWAFGLPRFAAVSDMLGDNDSVGVSLPLAPVNQIVGTSYRDGHGVFAPTVIDGAVYCTGWQRAAVTVTLHADGALELP